MVTRDNDRSKVADPTPWSTLLWSAGLFIAVSLGVEMSIEMPRDSLLSPVWVANACVLASLLANRKRTWPVLIASALAANILVACLGRISAASSGALAFSNIVEDLIAVLVFQRWTKGDDDLLHPLVLLRLAGACGLAVGVSAVLSSSLVFLLSGSPMEANVRTWGLAHTLGLLTVTPCLLIVRRWRHYLGGRRLGWRAPAAVGLLVLVTGAVFAQSRFPILFLVPPVLLLVSLEMEVFGAAAGVLIVEVIALGSLLTRTGPLTLVQGDAVEKAAVIQVFLIAALVTSLPIAVLNARRRQAMTALAESEARYRRLADNASDIVTEAGLDGRFTYVSPAARIITGFAEHELIGQKALDLVHPEDRARVEAEIGAALGSPGGKRIEHRHIAKDGRIVWVESRPILVRDPQTGRPVAINDVLRDITERKAAQTALAQSESRYRLIADNASDMISQFKPGGVITFITPGCRHILGYEPDEMVGRRALELAHPDDLENVRAYYQALRQSAGSLPEPLQFRARRKDGRWVWLEGHPKMFFDRETGEATEMQGVVRDVTTRKELESQLHHARVEAESAAAVKSEFLANMSHELRTPLTSILGFSKLLGDQAGLDDAGRRYLQRVSNASQALLTTVNDVLDFSKLEAGQVEIAPHPIDPAALTTSAVELLSPQAVAKGLTLTVDCEGLPAEVLADDTRIRQILLNLVSNAVKFTASGGVAVNARYDHATERLRFEVADTGPGVPADRLDRLFKRFSQVDASTTRSHGGTGLGLAICKGLAEAMDGSVGAFSIVGQGSRFWFELPCPAVAQTAAEEALAALCASSDLQGLRAIIADDNAVNRELVRIILTPFGVQLAEADGGRAAIDLAEREPFDLILMDVRMPDVDGPTAARAIRAGDGPNTTAPIIAFTAEANDRELPAAWKGLFNDQLPKPIIAADLLVVVNGWRSVETTDGVDATQRRG
jgi:PAS domain S-box-containing protein